MKAVTSSSELAAAFPLNSMQVTDGRAQAEHCLRHCFSEEIRLQKKVL